ncbi:MAG: hypothetical protein IPJ84_14685 [Bdellovibrionales bacterium]|nr:hypothetical protein [Bdellovibrionales bacterium]
MIATLIGVVILLRPRHQASATTFVKASALNEPKAKGFWRLILGMAAVKCILIGWQLNMVFWVGELFGPSSIWNGVSFIVLGIFFALGSIRPNHWDILAGALGMITLEVGLLRHPVMWWVSLVLLGYWFGSYLSYTTGKLGWNQPEKVGQQNSFWLALTDLPSALIQKTRMKRFNFTVRLLLVFRFLQRNHL